MAQQHVCNEMGTQTKHDVFRIVSLWPFRATIEIGATPQLGFTVSLKDYNFEAKNCLVTGNIFSISVTEHLLAQ